MKCSKIIVKPPGSRSKECIERNKASRAQVPRYVASTAKGVYVTDLDGNIYLDFRNQEVNTGHANPEVIAAVIEQITTGGFYVGLLPKVILAEKLKEIAPISRGDTKVGFARGGSNSAEHVIQMVRSYTKRRGILVCQGSYHGDLLGSKSLTMDSSEGRRGIHWMMPGVAYVPFAYCYRCPFKQDYPECELLCTDYIEYVLDTVSHPKDTAAFFLEPIQQHGGVIVPPYEYLKKIRKICDEHEILFVDDEVATGFGRTGKMFGIEHWEIEPDVMFMGKPIANGLNLGAVISSSEIMEFYRGLKGNPVSCAASLANIEVIMTEKLIENSLKLGEYIMNRLKEMQDEYNIIGDVRGKGMLIGVELIKNKQKKPAIDEAKKVYMKAYENGLLIGLVGTYRQVLRLTPPLTITKEQADEALSIIERTLRELNFLQIS